MDYVLLYRNVQSVIKCSFIIKKKHLTKNSLMNEDNIVKLLFVSLFWYGLGMAKLT